MVLIRRLLAYLIDWYLISMAMNLVMVVAAYQVLGVAYAGMVPLAAFDARLQVALVAIFALLDIAYFCVLPCYALSGQTLGKRLLRLRVVRAPRRVSRGDICRIGRRESKRAVVGSLDEYVSSAQGSRLALGNYLFRELLGIVIIEGCFSPLSNYLRNVLMLWLPRDAVQVIVWAGIVVGVVSVTLMLLTKERRMIHDLVGGTRVILVEHT